jgi:O-antigen/teichoic acid export membrane protein
MVHLEEEKRSSAGLAAALARKGRVEVVSLRKIVTGTALVSSANLIRVLSQFIALPVLSRLLTPTDYGLVGIAMPFITFAMIITDAGVGVSLVRSSLLGEDDAWSTSFWLILAFGLGLAMTLAALAPLAAYMFGEPRLEPIVIALAYTIGAQAVAVIPGAALQQARRFHTIAAIDIGCVLVSLATALVAGVLGAGVWALVAQQVALFTTRSVAIVVFSPFRPRLAFNFSQIKPHLTFGRDVLGVNVIAHFSGSIDNLVIGQVLGSASVGFYAMPMQFIRLPAIVVTGPLQFVLYSHLAAIKDNLAAIRQTFLLVTRVLGIIIFPSLGMVAAAHFSTFDILLSEKWSQSSTIFMILASAGAVQAMMALGADIMLVLGRSDLRLRTIIEFSLIWLCALLLSVSHGIYWVSIAYNCAVLLYLPRTMRLVLCLIQCSFKSYLEAIAVPALATLTSIVIYAEISRLFAPTRYADVGVAALFLQRRSLANESALVALPLGSKAAVP